MGYSKSTDQPTTDHRPPTQIAYYAYITGRIKKGMDLKKTQRALSPSTSNHGKKLMAKQQILRENSIS